MNCKDCALPGFGFLALALIVVGGLVFGPSLSFGYVPYDDPAYITGNGFVKKGLSMEGIRWAFFGGDSEILLHQGVSNLWHGYHICWMLKFLGCSFLLAIMRSI